MNRLIIITFLLVVFSATAFGQGAGKITGTVHLGSEDTVLHQVSVQIVELKRTTTTDKSGNYTFDDIPPGRYTVTAHQEGFGDSSKKLEVTAGAGATADFNLRISGLKEQVTVTGSGAPEC